MTLLGGNMATIPDLGYGIIVTLFLFPPSVYTLLVVCEDDLVLAPGVGQDGVLGESLVEEFLQFEGRRMNTAHGGDKNSKRF